MTTAEHVIFGTGAIGLMVAWMGNRLPKTFVPNASARRFRRFAGWSLALSGLAYAGLFAFAPLPVAYSAGPIAILGGLAATAVYGLTLRGRGKAA